MSAYKDRELLELAAKAARKHFNPTVRDPRGLWVVKDGASCQSDQELWNPLIDMTAALRLAVKLTMLIDFITKPIPAYMSGHVVAVSKAGACYEPGFTDEATCRAIVRAAAEIGKAMP